MSKRSVSPVLILIGLCLMTSAWATGKPDPQVPSGTHSNASSDSSASSVGLGIGVGIGQGGKSDATSNAIAQGGDSRAEGGTAVAGGGRGGDGGDSSAVAAGGTGGASTAEQSQTAQGGNGGDAAAGADASASNAGNSQAVNYNTPRQVPPVFLAGLMVSECGSGVSAGGADGGGAGAFGFVWTTDRCYALRSAINFFAIGDYETGCELLLYVNSSALKKIKRKPDCAAIAERLTFEAEQVSVTREAPPVDLSQYATKTELDRAFKTSQSK